MFPGFTARQIEPFRFRDQLAATQGSAHARLSGQGGALKVTQGGHIQTSGLGGQGPRNFTEAGYETKPSGNSVSLEEQMMLLADNQTDYQAVTALYQEHLSLIRTASRRS
jgi:flagellar basal-body rod protein FlgB